MAEKHPESMNPNALPIDVAAQLLSKAGGRVVSEETLRSDIDAGAPTNPDGTINLVHYAAWNVQQIAGMTDGN
ncbi:hypothetical protein Mal52_30060 [Symmachiella dynata]|uniref:Uncharacterized protein n=1 Tax=Symmachiella dynata TaxID=2527995 RepID=A0A517ZQ04_9PLAN|nr:hypothetical protein [Symmachiella dynata]QDU44523.1 hypothetical protein Mal52_30060 [Symmachiella dynata]